MTADKYPIPPTDHRNMIRCDDWYPGKRNLMEPVVASRRRRKMPLHQKAARVAVTVAIFVGFWSLFI